MNPEDALRSEIHEALDSVSGPMPELLPGIAPRLRSSQKSAYPVRSTALSTPPGPQLYAAIARYQSPNSV